MVRINRVPAYQIRFVLTHESKRRAVGRMACRIFIGTATLEVYLGL